QRYVNPLDAPGPHLIDALQDSRRVGYQGVAASGAEVVDGQPFEDFVADPVGRGDGQVEGDRVGNSGAVAVGWRLPGGGRELPDLLAGPVDQYHADAQAAEEVDVQEQIGEVVVGDDGAVQGDH